MPVFLCAALLIYLLLRKVKIKSSNPIAKNTNPKIKIKTEPVSDTICEYHPNSASPMAKKAINSFPIILILKLININLSEKRQPRTHAQRSPAQKDAFGVARAGSLYYHPTSRVFIKGNGRDGRGVQKEALPATLRSFELYGRLTRLEVSIMAINEGTKLEELERIKGELRELLPLLSKWRVEELQKLISQHYTTQSGSTTSSVNMEA